MLNRVPTVLSALLILGGATGAFGQAPMPETGTAQVPITQKMGITQKLGSWVPMDVPFKDETGKDVRFGDMFRGRPVMLLPIFYGCKTGCALITDGLVQTLTKATKKDHLKPGRDFDVVMVDINPKEPPELAAAKKNYIFDALTPTHQGTIDEKWRAEAESGWHLLTGSLDNIHRITNSVGFRYSYDPVKDLVNHPTCSIILTPKGQISSYTIGNEFPTKVVESDLALATKGDVGQAADQSFMFGCIMMDPNTGKYHFVVWNIIRAGCVLTLIVLIGSILSMNFRSRRANTALDGGGPNITA